MTLYEMVRGLMATQGENQRAWDGIRLCNPVDPAWQEWSTTLDAMVARRDEINAVHAEEARYS